MAVKEEKVFNVLVEKVEDGYYVASVIELPGCHTQAKTLDLLNKRIKEAIEGYLEVVTPEGSLEFVGLQQIRLQVTK